DYIVQDGGSTDGTLEVLQRNSSRLKTWTSESDQGQADAIAKGFAKTTGGPDDLMAGLIRMITICRARWRSSQIISPVIRKSTSSMAIGS
ncbi:MAG: hyaD 2, partial [Lacunisphaera sp.]|nr:hyaD 2 [Lacunisphaera sp.]